MTIFREVLDSAAASVNFNGRVWDNKELTHWIWEELHPKLLLFVKPAGVFITGQQPTRPWKLLFQLGRVYISKWRWRQNRYPLLWGHAMHAKGPVNFESRRTTIYYLVLQNWVLHITGDIFQQWAISTLLFMPEGWLAVFTSKGTFGGWETPNLSKVPYEIITASPLA